MQVASAMFVLTAFQLLATAEIAICDSISQAISKFFRDLFSHFIQIFHQNVISKFAKYRQRNPSAVIRTLSIYIWFFFQ